MKSGEELLKELPERLLDGITRGRKRALERTKSPAEFLAKLRELAKSTRASWAFGFPRTGSSWFGCQFLGNFRDNIYKEPFDLFQASGQKENRDKLNLETQHEAPRPEIQKELDLTEAPLDRLLLAVHDSFWFYHHLDSILVADLKEFFPRSNFLFWCRDLRDVLHSFAFPEQNHWPLITSPMLGEEAKERFFKALIRINGWIKNHLAALRNFKKDFHWARYENFSANFVDSGADVLDFYGLDYEQSELEKMADDFEARHGMWEDWEPWQLGMFYYMDARQFNRTLGYGKGGEEAGNVWERPVPEEKLPPVEEVEKLIDDIQSNS